MSPVHPPTAGLTIRTRRNPPPQRNDRPAKRSRGRTSIAPPFLLLLSLLSCAPVVKQFYLDSFLTEDGVYENKTIGFALLFVGNWTLITDPDEMTGPSLDLARDLSRTGAELLFIGTTIEATQGTRAIAVGLNEDPEIYAGKIRALNKDEIDQDYGAISFLAADKPMVKWEYRIGEYRFVEFVFAVRTYNVRIAFWAKPELYENFLPVYEEIMTTLSEGSRFR